MSDKIKISIQKKIIAEYDELESTTRPEHKRVCLKVIHKLEDLLSEIEKMEETDAKE